MPNRAAVIAEFIGTFALVIGCTAPAVIDAMSGGSVGLLGIAAANGLTVMFLIYAIGEVSGAHMNPAVTLAFAVARRLPWATVPLYVSAQLLGGIAGAATVAVLWQAGGATVPAADVTIAQAIGIEVVLSWMLMFVILGVCTGAKEKGLMAGAAIGSVVGVDVLLGATTTGASMNPARSLGPAIFAGELPHYWMYAMAPCIGTCAAVLCLCLIQPRECCSSDC